MELKRNQTEPVGGANRWPPVKFQNIGSEVAGSLDM